LIVERAFFLVAKDVVRLLDLLKTLFGRFVVGIEVGVVFFGHGAIRLLQLGSGRVAADPQNFVIIFAHTQILRRVGN
jgi:hypothetical protein